MKFRILSVDLDRAPLKTPSLPKKQAKHNIYYKIAFHGEYLKKNERVGNDPDIFCPDIFCPSYFVRARASYICPSNFVLFMSYLTGERFCPVISSKIFCPSYLSELFCFVYELFWQVIPFVRIFCPDIFCPDILSGYFVRVILSELFVRVILFCLWVILTGDTFCPDILSGYILSVPKCR